MKLKEILLPEGDVGSITVGWPSTTGEAIRLDPATWLSQGFDGVRLIGRGIGRTQVRCSSWDGITLKVGRHQGTVQLEELTLVSGYDRAALIGAPDITRPIARKFGFIFKNARAFAPQVAAGAGRPRWLFHLYQADDHFEDCELDGMFLSEHPYYAHGHAKFGSLWRRVRVRSGAECDKNRSDATETLWAGPNVWIIREDVHYESWYEEWSSRGGAASVRQGSAAHNRWTRCTFSCGKALGGIPAHLRSRTFMVTSESNSYDQSTGIVDKAGGFGNGKVIVEDCGASGGPGIDGLSLLARVGPQGNMNAAKSVLVQRSGFWGERMQLQLGGIPAGKTVIRDCNTPELEAYCDALGWDTSHECVVALQHRVLPLSEGLIR